MLRNSVTYTIRISYTEEALSDVMEEIEEASEPHDDTLEKSIQRWLGGPMQDAEVAIENHLPDGFMVKIEDAE